MIQTAGVENKQPPRQKPEKVLVVGTKKKPAKLALNLSLMQAAESVGEASKKLRLEQENLPGRKVGITYEDDEDSLFCQSLAKE